MLASRSTTSADADDAVTETKWTGWPGMEYPDFTLTSSASNPYAKRRLHQQSDGSLGDLSGYEPHMEHISDATLRQLPPYVFRVAHDKSAGSSEAGHYRSRALQQLGEEGRVDFFSLSTDEQALQVGNHVSQVNFNSHWISFTDSPLTAICRALQHQSRKQTNIRLHVINTMKIKKPALIVSSYATLRGYRVCVRLHPARREKLLGCAYAEFLVWDELIAEAAVVDLKDFLKPPNLHRNFYTPGLLDLIPKLRRPATNKTGGKYRKAYELRELLYGQEQENERKSQQRLPWGPERKNCQPDLANWRGPSDHQKRADIQDNRHALDNFTRRQFERLVEKFPDEFKMVMLAFFLCMVTHDRYEDSIVDELASFARQNPTTCIPHYCCTTNVATPRKPEVETFQRIFVNSFEQTYQGTQAKRGMLDVQRNIIRLDTRQVMLPETPYQKFIRCQELRAVAARARPTSVSSLMSQTGKRAQSLTTDESLQEPARKKMCILKTERFNTGPWNIKDLQTSGTHNRRV